MRDDIYIQLLIFQAVNIKSILFKTIAHIKVIV